ncbi:MAG: peptidoglycan-associated lipoprotein Pal [Myxococcota bacterium]
MRQRFFTHWAIAALAAAGLALGCASSGGGDETIANTSDFEGGMDTRGADDGTGALETPTGLEAVYFDFDSASLRSDQRATLQANGGAINQNASWKTVVLEGHCDERGSEEYNLALGERRANSVKQYLVDSGVSGARIDTVSFGEAKPAVQGHDESAWKWNRRVEFSAIR